MKGNKCRNNYLIKIIFSVSFILLSICGTAKCEDDYKPSDSIKFKLFYNDNDKAGEDKNQKDFQFGIMGNLSSGSSDLKNGYGGALLSAYNRFSPVVLRFIPNGYWTKFERILPGDNFISINLDLDILLSSSFEIFRPYSGFGLNFYSNTWSADKPAGLHEFGPYSELTQSAFYDYGKGIAPHLRLGLQIVTERKINFIIDVKITNIKSEIPVIYHYNNGEERQGTVTYKLNPISLYLGIITQIDSK